MTVRDTRAPVALLVTLLFLALTCAGAGAQTIYKCSHNGQTSYGDTPCAAGLSSKIAPQQPSEADDSIMRRQQRALHQIEKEHATENAAGRKEVAAINARRKRCADLKLQQQWLAEDAAKAAPKSQDKAQQNLRRGAEKLASACQD